MGQLLELQRELKDLLFIGGKASKSKFWKHGTPERLGVYRNNVHLNWTDTLDSDYPLTRKQFSADAWERLSEKYFVQNPPRHWELNTSVVPFAKFLEKQRVPAHVKELADYELADLSTFLHTAVPQPGIGVTNPTVSVHVYKHQIFFWVQAGAKASKPPAAKPEVLLFFRDSEHRVCIEEADPLTLLLLEHFKKPDAQIDKLEADRRQILPNNKVPLQSVLKGLIRKEIIYL